MDKLAALVELAEFTCLCLAALAGARGKRSCSNVTFPARSASANYKSTT